MTARWTLGTWQDGNETLRVFAARMQAMAREDDVIKIKVDKWALEIPGLQVALEKAVRAKFPGMTEQQGAYVLFPYLDFLFNNCENLIQGDTSW